jgi:hypothetical protein
VSTNNHKILLALGAEFKNWELIPFNVGLINQSFIVQDLNGQARFFIQQINTGVFNEPDKIVSNYLKIWNHLIKHPAEINIAKPISFSNEKYGFIDENNNFWRCVSYVENSKTIATISSAEQAFLTGHTFASFTSALTGLDSNSLEPTIIDFHNLSLRAKQFNEAVATGLPKRIKQADSLIKLAMQGINYINFFNALKVSKQDFKLRAMHHDAKIANILFDKTTNKPICPVDLDTTMPGYYFSDLGDMIRSTAATIPESSVAFNEIEINTAYYKALVDGYSSVAMKSWTDVEKKYAHAAGLLMIYMQAIRFLADYLVGDKYYKISGELDNFNRAKNQFILLEKLETYLQKEYSFKL